jgi:DNA polymerase-3 subunit delta
MKAQDLFQDIRRGKIEFLYYFYGPERWFIKDVLERIRERALDPKTQDLNHQVFDAKEDGPDVILAALEIFPIASPRRMVVIHNADVIWKQHSAIFIHYIENLNPRTCAIFVGEKADSRARFFRALAEKGKLVGFYPLSEKEQTHWIRIQAKQLGNSITDEAITVLLERIGSSLAELNLELEKISLRKKRGQSIEEEDVVEMSGSTRTESPFDLTRSLGRTDWRNTVRLLHRNLEQGEPPLLLLSLVLRQLRLIWRALEMQKTGCLKREIEGNLRIHPRMAHDFWKQVENFPLGALRQLWPLTQRIDEALKSSRVPKDLLLEKYLWDLCRIVTALPK